MADAPVFKSRETIKGLTNLRASKGAVKVRCSNCNCERFGACGCQKKGEKSS